MASIADVYVTVLPETSRIAGGIEKALRRVDADVLAAAKRWKKTIDRELGHAEVDVSANTTEAKKDIKQVEKGRYHAKVNVGVDRPSLAKANREINQVLGAAGSRAAGATKLGAGLGALSIAPNVVPLLGQVATAAGQLSGLLGLIPAAAGGAGLAVGALKVAVSGFGDALGEVRDPAKFAEAIAQLSPNAQGAATSIQKLLPQLDQLKYTVQDAGFKGIGDQIGKLGTTYLPVFQTVMSQMAASANKALTGVSEMLQTPEMRADITTFGTNAAAAFDILAGALQPIVKAFADIAVVGSSFLPQLAGTVSDLATRFGDFISDARESGKLADWIQGGIDAFTDLKDIVVNVWDTFTGLFRAAAGPEGAGGLLQTVSDLTGKLSDFVNSPEGQGKLAAFFADAKDELDKWWPVLKELPGIFWTAFTEIKSVIDSTIFPILSEVTRLLTEHPGLIEGVVTAFLAWKTISGVTALATSLKAISTALSVTLPASAATAAAGISSKFAALGTIAVPVTIVVTAVLAGDAMSRWLFEHDPLKNLRPGGTNTPPFLPNTPTANNGQPVPGSRPASPIPRPQLTDQDRMTLQYQGINPDTAPVEDLYRGLGRPLPIPASTSVDRAAQDYRRGGAPYTDTAPLPTPAVSSYVPPTPTPSSSRGGAASGQGIIVTPENAMAAIAFAAQQQGKPYGWGGVGPTLYDCSGYMSDLYAIMTGKPYQGSERFFTTESNFEALGFEPGFQAGAFNVGVSPASIAGDNAHMAGTLPNGVNVESGGSGGGVRYGGGAKGAKDFPIQYHLPVSDALNVGAQNAGYGYDGPGINRNSPMYTEPAKKDAKKDSDGEQLANDIVSGFAEIFGFGELFKSPLDFGLFKGFKSLMKALFGGDDDGKGLAAEKAATAFGTGGSGSPLLDLIKGITPKPYGDINVGSPAGAPTEFIPGMSAPGGGGGFGGVLALAGAAGGAAGPGNAIDQRVVIQGNQFGHSAQAVGDTIYESHMRQARPGYRNLPGP